MLIFVRKNEWAKTHYQIREVIEFDNDKIECWNKNKTKVLYFDLFKDFDGKNWNTEEWKNSKKEVVKDIPHRNKD